MHEEVGWCFLVLMRKNFCGQQLHLFLSKNRTERNYYACIILKALRTSFAFAPPPRWPPFFLPRRPFTGRGSCLCSVQRTPPSSPSCREVRLTYFKLRGDEVQELPRVSSPAQEASHSAGLRMNHPEQMDIIWICAWIGGERTKALVVLAEDRV